MPKKMKLTEFFFRQVEAMQRLRIFADFFGEKKKQGEGKGATESKLRPLFEKLQ